MVDDGGGEVETIATACLIQFREIVECVLCWERSRCFHRVVWTNEMILLMMSRMAQRKKKTKKHTKG